MIRVLWGVNSLLRVGANSYTLIALYFLFIAVIGLAGYALLRRKAAAIAAGSTAMLLLGMCNLIVVIANSLLSEVLLVILDILVGTGVIYGWYIFLDKAKRPRLAAFCVVAISLIVGLATSLAAFFFMRMSFVS